MVDKKLSSTERLPVLFSGPCLLRTACLRGMSGRAVGCRNAIVRTYILLRCTYTLPAVYQRFMCFQRSDLDFIGQWLAQSSRVFVTNGACSSSCSAVRSCVSDYT